jgi:hypothetical protein
LRNYYGNPPTFDIDYPVAKTNLNRKKDPYLALIGEMDSCLIPLIAHIVNLIEHKVIKKTYLEFAYDLVEASNKQY